MSTCFNLTASSSLLPSSAFPTIDQVLRSAI